MTRGLLVHQLSNWLHQLDLKGMRFLAHHIPRWSLPKPKAEVQWPTIYGFSLWIDPSTDVGVEHSLYYMGSYERGTMNVMDLLLKKGGHFVDIGANVGFMTVYAAKKVGPSGLVSAFEPHPHTHKRLLKNLQLNNVDKCNVYAVALGAATGEAMLREGSEGNRGAASLIAQRSGEGNIVPIRRLDGFFSGNGSTDANKDVLPAPDLIKIDVEGYEIEVLRGADQLLHSAEPPALILECSAWEARSGSSFTEALYHHFAELPHYSLYRSVKSKAYMAPLRPVKNAQDMPTHDNVYALCERHVKMLHYESV